MANAIRTLADRPSAPAEPKLALRDLELFRERPDLQKGMKLTVTATDRLTFDVAAGEFVCLLGPSGCGKTSLLNVLAGLVEPTSGQALLDGRPITGPGPDRAVLFQEPALFPWLSVRGNVELGLDLIGVPLSERRAVAQRWLANVHLEGWADAQPHELSAGMRQRVALARALAADPDVVLADEPFGALDAQARELLQREVQRVWVESQNRKTFLFVTHNVREATLLATRGRHRSAHSRSRPGRTPTRSRCRRGSSSGRRPRGSSPSSPDPRRSGRSPPAC